ncbi:NAD(P)-binding domain-containing protein [Endozoicomonas elysicola]|uniref:Trimethylamine monooxygenase n=1 Tax=Endozoicomonas elysicola TaxID=305900 RepID=A0A081K627_9GAMM|nr:NAD(P)/FAD-dependent oxidoreductase [Endozoicomonas elysicola]KEI69603.1 potassium transporter [Endozoicomonas elysicola]
MTRVAVIGAGPSGISVLHAFKSAKDKGADIPEIVCFEKQKTWGGLWNFTWRTGLDEYGEPVHSSMYRHLWSNGPKECLEFADYSFEEHFGSPIPSYPPREVLADYIFGRAKKSGLRNWIQFRHTACWIEYHQEQKVFSVIVHDLVNDCQKRELFDFIIVATGHFSTPNVPEFEGIETFPGRVLHAHDFRDAREFNDQAVLIIGSSYSAEDIGSQCLKFGAKSITASYRTNPMNFDWPENWETKQLLTNISGNTAHFKDGTCKDVDAIILCTGYLHHFPFMQDDIRLVTTNRLWTPGLYQGIALENNPRVMYLGMQDQFYTFTLFDAQAWWARDIILQRINLPSAPDMSKHSAKWQERESTLKTDEDKIWFQGDYVRELINQTDYPPLDTEAINELFMAWEHHKHQDIMSYRSNRYRSVITGIQAPLLKTPWSKAMDDSMAVFLNNHCPK